MARTAGVRDSWFSGGVQARLCGCGGDHKRPAGPAPTHIRTSYPPFRDTPNGQGLLPAAGAQARTAAQRAGPAGQTPATSMR